MALLDIVMPKMGESIMEATILKWHKQPGDTIKADETLLDIATDKVDSEVPSTAEGIVKEILFKENDVVAVGAVIARVESEVSVGTSSYQPAPAPAVQPVVQSAPPPSPPVTEEIPYQPVGAASSSSGIRFYSPLVLNIAAQEGIAMSELETIPGTGNDGRVTKKDIIQYVSQRGRGVSATPSPQRDEVRVIAVSTPAQTEPVKPPSSPAIYSGNVEIIEMDRMRKLIADHMVKSKHTSPHVTSFSEADVTNLVMWRDKVKKDFEKREGTKITFTPLIIEAIVRCLKKYPLMNSSIDGDKIIIKKDINVGMATALPTGNLIVPVIKNADQLNLSGLAKQVNYLADAARNGKLKADDTQGGTFTFTNVGTFGSLMGTPIINQPQVAILAVGTIKKRPVVIETPHGDSIAIRHMMYISMSYDHRIVDGSLGATFLTAVANELERFNPEREI
ncbi:MAG: dihydrolipoamide acetyltransferase family protein [Bacteroidota bacterium]|jgi:2-oxoglutarate dehydrogenase E2 component (dihydrolipoamide succinyltransferase)